MNKLIITSLFIFFSFGFIFTQDEETTRHYEIGIELDDISFSNLGGRFGAGLKFAVVENKTMAFGPTVRFNRLWSKNTFSGIEGSGTFLGVGGFYHYRTMDWFFLGSEIEFLQNPYTLIKPSQIWSLTAFLGGGISRETPIGVFNLGLFYDIADAVRDPLTNNPSPLRNSYFIKRQNPNPTNNQPDGAYLPIIYRFAFFIPLG